MGQGGQSGVNWGSKVIFAPMLPKFSGKKPFCKAFKDLSLVFRFSYFKLPIGPLVGVGGWGGQLGVKRHFRSNLHQIWWEEAFCQLLKYLS